MDPLHVVVGIPLARKSSTWERTFTIFNNAENLLVIVHSMRFPFMPQETSSRRKGVLSTSRLFASIRFQMRVQMFAEGG